ncbi:ribonuclease H-like protein [Periconia macrospinosa]|uniref:Ribonuclease H-like protein n=1 Tax=Periconia macrospinosa TaxID=97972 RepID=A0A2V1DK36_9PLEO|nr:ribonuclease H-like protein [Periconia macrospinosa]
MTPGGSLISSLFTSRAPTVKRLQNVLQQIGCATSGKKDALHGRILHAISTPPTLISRKETKILSVDMGIKNLAYCVAKVTPSSSETRGPATMDILAWRRLDLTEETWKYSSKNVVPPVEEEGGKEESETEEMEEEKDVFSPKNLSSTAFSLVRELLKHEPDVILIERQRWRSAGSSAIQQWTVRVNSLEAMLWAMFTAFRGMSSVDRFENSAGGRKEKDFEVYSVDPKRVGNYWLDSMQVNSRPPLPPNKAARKRSSKTSPEPLEGPDNETAPIAATKPPPRAKAEKKAKIQILRTWLDRVSPSTALPLELQTQPDDTSLPLLPRPDIHFAFTSKSQPTNTSTHNSDNPSTVAIDEEDPVIARAALLRATSPATSPTTKRAKKGESSVTDKAISRKEKKIDDITDCFLQAAAFVAWQESLGVLRGMVEGQGLEEERARVDGDGGKAKTRKKRTKKNV